MPASPPDQAVKPLCRTPAVLKAFGFGLALGMLGALCIVFILVSHFQIYPPGEGRNRADIIVMGDGETRFVPASSCDVFRELAETRNASGPVRFRVELPRVVDGDTIRAIWHGENLSIRLLGISAPERSHPGGPESTQCLRELLVGAETVDLEFDGDVPRRDSRGRLLAYVWRDDMLLNLEMVRRGHAGLYKGGGYGKHGDILRQAVP